MKTPSKEHKIGNTTITVYSPLTAMASEGRKKWFEEEWRKGNPTLQRIAETARNCYKK